MTRNQHELIYLEALEFLRRRGKRVENPYTSDAGTRFACVDQLPCEDDLVFTEAWGRSAAERIMQSRPAAQPLSGNSFFLLAMMKKFRYHLRLRASVVHGLSSSLRPRS